MEVKEKIAIIMEIYSYKLNKDFANYLGLVPNTISSWKKRGNINTKLLVEKCDKINTHWLMTGEGPILKSDYENQYSEKSNINDPLNGYTNNFTSSTPRIPFIPFESFGRLTEKTVMELDSESIKESYFIPLFNGIKIDFMLPVLGSSMSPKYNSGNVVGCRLLSEIEFIQWNKVYVIATKSQGTIINRLKPSKRSKYVTCQSDNKEYGDFEISKTDIQTIALIVGMIGVD